MNGGAPGGELGFKPVVGTVLRPVMYSWCGSDKAAAARVGEPSPASSCACISPLTPASSPCPAQVCFDRGGFRYHGRVEALADAAREAGLNF